MRSAAAGLLLCFVLGCDYFAGEASVRTPSPSKLVGVWRSAPFEAQLGTSIETFCFRADGVVVVNESTQAGPLHNRGRYRFDGKTLTLSWPTTGSSATARVKIGAQRLWITFDSGTVRVYRKIGAKCSEVPTAA
jgi:hypothetical protein